MKTNIIIEVGQKLTCIDEKIDRKKLMMTVNFYKNWVKKDKRYTVRGVNPFGEVLLCEIINPLVYEEEYDKYFEPGFNIERFVSPSTIRRLTQIEQERYYARNN